MALPTDKQTRKETPIYSGVLKYFPDALAEVARVSFIGNEQHNPGEPLHWAKEKSKDEPDACVRHLLESETEDGMPRLDEDNTYHAAKAAWRALAHLQRLMDKVQARDKAIMEAKPYDFPYDGPYGPANPPCPFNGCAVWLPGATEVTPQT